MLSAVVGFCLLASGFRENLSLNQRIKEVRESQVTIGTVKEAQEARRWGHRVYLATYPRSGNHWMRYLIEEATGIATSSTYPDPDPPHLETAFPWGGYCCDHGYEGNSRYPVKGEIAVIKTHFPTMYISHFETLPYSKAVRIIRHPVDSFYSFYVWQKNFHKETPEFLIPRERLKKCIRSWRRFQEYWDFAENVLTIRYEDLYNNPGPYLKLALAHIGYQVAQESIDRAIAKYPPTGGLLKYFDHFTEEDLSIIETELSDLMYEYGYELRAILPL